MVVAAEVAGGYIYADMSVSGAQPGATGTITYHTQSGIKATCVSFCYHMAGRTVSKYATNI